MGGEERTGRSDDQLPEATFAPAGESTAAQPTPREWLRQLSEQEHPPNTEQVRVLEIAIERVEFELQEEATDQINRRPQEPLRMMVQGVPGSGKSRLI